MKSFTAPPPRDHAVVFTLTRPETLAGAGASAATCCADLPCSFSAFSATFALGTIPAATAVPVSATKSAINAITIAGLGTRNRILCITASFGSGFVEVRARL